MSLFEDSLADVGVTLAPRELETLAVFVQRHMDGRSRNYHGLNHIFELVQPNSSIYNLAAIYHDIIQLNADTGYSPHVASRLQPYIELRDGKKYIKDFSSADHFYAELVLDVFSRERGQEITTQRGENEFLSALIAAVEIGKYLKREEMLQVIVCIEATTPFRLPHENGKNVFELLMDRIEFINSKYKLNLSNDAMIKMNQQAVDLANNDVYNFADEAVEYFIFNTWALFPETNVPMRYPRTISTTQYRKAIQGTVGFFGFLKPSIIFHEYKGFPKPKTYETIVKRTTYNLGVSRMYFGAILYCCTLIEAISSLTGGDSPISLFVGDIPEIGHPCPKASFVFPEVRQTELFESTVYSLLHQGREQQTKCLLSAFPAAAYVYGSLGTDFITSNLAGCHKFYEGKMSAREFLDLHSDEFLFDLFGHLSKIANTRKIEMFELLKHKKAA